MLLYIKTNIWVSKKKIRRPKNRNFAFLARFWHILAAKHFFFYKDFAGFRVKTCERGPKELIFFLSNHLNIVNEAIEF